MSRKQKIKKQYPKAKIILSLAKAGTLIASAFLFPGMHRVYKGSFPNFDDFLNEDEWEEFDGRRLRQRLKDMRKRKLIEIFQVKNKFVVQITEKGKKRLLQYNLQELKIPTPKKWDGKWRIVSYDVPKGKNRERDAIRQTLKNLGFWQLQKSVYLYPYPCKNVIDFLREIHDIGEHVTLLTVGYLESEKAYKEYFAL